MQIIFIPASAALNPWKFSAWAHRVTTTSSASGLFLTTSYSWTLSVNSLKRYSGSLLPVSSAISLHLSLFRAFLYSASALRAPAPYSSSRKRTAETRSMSLLKLPFGMGFKPLMCVGAYGMRLRTSSAQLAARSSSPSFRGPLVFSTKNPSGFTRRFPPFFFRGLAILPAA